VASGERRHWDTEDHPITSGIAGAEANSGVLGLSRVSPPETPGRVWEAAVAGTGVQVGNAGTFPAFGKGLYHSRGSPWHVSPATD
jgi:hypothetical protein